MILGIVIGLGEKFGLVPDIISMLYNDYYKNIKLCFFTNWMKKFSDDIEEI